MEHTPNADDYEKDFLERYFKKTANQKIKEQQSKLLIAKTEKEAENCLKRIEATKKELEGNLEFLKTEVTIPKEDTLKVENLLDPEKEKGYFEYKSARVPLYIWNYLFGYQQHGVKWMLNLYFEEKGGVLADEMGLGKTIQAISVIIGLLEGGVITRALILCPATLVRQWITEFKRLFPAIKVSKHMRESGSATVMGYEAFKRTKLRKLYDIVFLDEGHRIKNKDSQIAIYTKQIRCNSKFILTGTPIQNNLRELWSLFDFVMPGLLGSHLTFQEEFEDNIRQRMSEEQSYRYSVMLRSIVEPYILRRLKSQISHKLPGKTDKVLFVSLTPQQSRLYIKALESRQFQRVYEDKASLLGAIDTLRKICNHPRLLTHSKLKKLPQIKNRLDYYTNGDLGGTTLVEGYDRESCTSSVVSSSSKMVAAMELLEKWYKEKRKVLFFTQTVQMQEIIEEALKERSYIYSKMSGRTNTSSRASLVDNFNMDPRIFVFLLTTRVGGMGLNLTSASRIILFDSDWNPSTDIQAKERIYRYGQNKEVEICRILCRNTIEERIYQRQIYKSCLSRKILLDPTTKIDKDIVIDLFSYIDVAQACEIVDDVVDVTKKDKEPELMAVREEDKRMFNIMKKFNSKVILSGKELIEFIERREMNLL